MTSVRAPLQLPESIALFPLSGVILLPFGHVPLNIFEPRYIQMIDEILGQSRIVGIIQPREASQGPTAEDAELFNIGTAGRLVQFADPGNGRYHVTFEGLSRFRIKNEITDKMAYRMAEVDYLAYPNDTYPNENDGGEGKDEILALMKIYFDNNEIDADWSAVSEAPYEALVSSLAMTCPFEPTEKQALLECVTHKERAQMLVSLFEMSSETLSTPTTLKH